MDSIPVLVGFSLAVGVGLIANALFSIVHDLGRRINNLLGLRRDRLAILGLSAQQLRKSVYTEDDVLGLRSVPWTNFYAVAALIGLICFAFIGPYLPGLRVTFLFTPLVVWGLKRYLVYQRRRFLAGQVRHLLIDIRVHMSLAGSLLLGLDNIARSSHETGVVYRALKYRMAGGSVKNGQDVLQQLADDLKSPHLLRVIQRVRSAQQSSGLIGVDQALANSIEELNEEISTSCEEQIQHMPLRITLLAMPFLLGPIVILLFYPLVDRILKTLAGTAIGGGF